MLEKFNSFMEKWMAFVTPACLLTGVLFPDIAKHGVPYVTYAFAFMTFIGALKSRFRDVGYELRTKNPNKKFYFAGTKHFCPNMKLNTVEKVCHVLKTGENEVHVFSLFCHFKHFVKRHK